MASCLLPRARTRKLMSESGRSTHRAIPLHGPRGAALARELHGGAFTLDEGRMGLLKFACEEHTNGGVSSDPTIGVCWDADRLNLWRVGRRRTRGCSRRRWRGERSASVELATCSGNASPGGSCVRASNCGESDRPVLRAHKENEVLI